MTIHGRANLSGGDLQLRIWQIGTHHEFEPDESTWDTVVDWLNAGLPRKDKEQYAIPASTVYLFADFEICPTEPFKKGWVQQAKVKSAVHRHYVKVGDVQKPNE
jgi:hypothetical protein